MCLNLCGVSIKLAREIVRHGSPSIVSIFNVLLSFVCFVLEHPPFVHISQQVRRKCSTLSSTAPHAGQLALSPF